MILSYTGVIAEWVSGNIIELFGALTGILYVFLEIKQDIRLWPVGIITSGVYVWVFFVNKLYADAGLQCYYLVVSVLGWYWWIKSDTNKDNDGNITKGSEVLPVSRIGRKMAFILAVIFIVAYLGVWKLLAVATDSPVPGADAFITTLSAVATYMLAKKYIEHWYLWIVINLFAAVLFYIRGLYPTIILYIIYFVMSFVGLAKWKRSVQ